MQFSRANEHPSRRITWQSRINIRWKFITSIMHTERIKWNEGRVEKEPELSRFVEPELSDVYLGIPSPAEHFSN